MKLRPALSTGRLQANLSFDQEPTGTAPPPSVLAGSRLHATSRIDRYFPHVYAMTAGPYD